MMARLALLFFAIALLAPGAMGQSKDPGKGKELSKQSLTKDQALQKYIDGLAYERAGNERAALTSFLEAGEAGYGIAQLKLAGIYDRGNSLVKRDYQTALYWYERARLQGIEVPKPQPPIKGR